MDIGTRVTGHIENDVGRIEFTGTISDAYTSGGKTIVAVFCDDGEERFAPIDKLKKAGTPEEVNLMTHTGKVHAPGTYYKALRARAPKCCASASSVARYHFMVPSTEPVDCRKCLNLLAK